MAKTRDSITIRLLLIGLLIMVLLIPTFMISGLVSERRHRKEEAIKEVADKMGGSPDGRRSDLDRALCQEG